MKTIFLVLGAREHPELLVQLKNVLTDRALRVATGCDSSLIVEDTLRTSYRDLEWYQDRSFLAREEESSKIQPTNPYFGKERWRRRK